MPVLEGFRQLDLGAHLQKLALVWEYTCHGPFFLHQQSSPADDSSEKPASPWSELPHSSNSPSYSTDCRDNKNGSGASSLAFGHPLEPPSKASQGGTANPGHRFCPWDAGFIRQQHSFDSELLPRRVTSAPHWEGRQL